MFNNLGYLNACSTVDYGGVNTYAQRYNNSFSLQNKSNKILVNIPNKNITNEKITLWLFTL